METTHKNLRYGVVGIGNIGYVHASCLFGGKVPGAELGALCDIRQEMEPELRAAFPGVPFYRDYGQMLAQADVDAVIVSVPHPVHAEVATAAFAAGKHVLVEKPMDIRLSRAKALCEAARRSGKRFGVMFNQRTGSLFAKAREIVSSGKLGQLKRSVWIITNWYRTQHYYDSGTWRATWLGEGGGVLVNQAPHQLDLWQWICGMPEQVTGFCREACYHNIEVEDEATLVVRFPGGGEGVFITSTGEYPGTNRLEISGSLGKLVLEGGVLKWWRLKQDEREFCFTSQQSFTQMEMEYEEFREEESQGHRMILEDFTRGIREGTPLLAPGYEAVRELTIQNAAYLSAWKGSVPVDLPMDEAEFDALLEKKQAASRLGTGAAPDKKNTQYQERWQIQW